jgi:predicted secreted protein
MVATAGRKVRISYNAGAGMAVIAGARTDSFTIANEMINITDKDDLGVQTLLNDIGVQSVAMDLEGVLKDDTLLALTAAAASGTSLHDLQVEIVGIGTLTCAGGFFLSNFVPNGAEGSDPTTFSCSMASSGPVTWTTEAFLMTIATTTATETFTIPCQNVGVFDATVNWGDGSKSVITAFNDADLAHVYATAGSYQIKITPNPNGAFPNIYFNNAGDRLKVTSVDNLGVMGWLTLQRAFFGLANMTSFIVGKTNTTSVTNVLQMLSNNTSLTNVSFDGIDTSNVTTFASMLSTCTSLPFVDARPLNTSSALTLNGMFFNDTSLTNIQGAQNFNIGTLNATTSLDGFATSVTLATANYDAILINWDAQNPFDGMSPNFGGSTYTGGGVAAAARANLISTDGWTIQDGGIA